MISIFVALLDAHLKLKIVLCMLLLQVEALRTALGQLSGRTLKFCSDACLRRYLEARNWNVDRARKMLEETLKWRSTFKPEDIRWVSPF